MSVQRKSSPSPTSPAAESDLETTAELPVLDVAAYEAATTEERLVNTDTWITQSPVASTPSAAVAAVGVAAPASVADESRDLDDRRLHDDRRTHDEKRANLEAGLHALSDNLREVAGGAEISQRTGSSHTPSWVASSKRTRFAHGVMSKPPG